MNIKKKKYYMYNCKLVDNLNLFEILYFYVNNLKLLPDYIKFSYKGKNFKVPYHISDGIKGKKRELFLENFRKYQKYQLERMQRLKESVYGKEKELLELKLESLPIEFINKENFIKRFMIHPLLMESRQLENGELEVVFVAITKQEKEVELPDGEKVGVEEIGEFGKFGFQGVAKIRGVKIFKDEDEFNKFKNEVNKEVIERWGLTEEELEAMWELIIIKIGEKMWNEEEKIVNFDTGNKKFINTNEYKNSYIENIKDNNLE